MHGFYRHSNLAGPGWAEEEGAREDEGRGHGHIKEENITGYRRSLFVRCLARRADASDWLLTEFIPRCIPLVALGVMFLMTLIRIGETPSGFAADLSSTTLACSSKFLISKPTPVLSPVCKQAGRLRTIARRCDEEPGADDDRLADLVHAAVLLP